METGLTKAELETTILFDEESQTASVYTFNAKWKKHMEETLGLTPTDTNQFDARTYEFPKKWLKLPRKPRVLSPEHKAKLSQRMKKLREKLSANKPSD